MAFIFTTNFHVHIATIIYYYAMILNILVIYILIHITSFMSHKHQYQPEGRKSKADIRRGLIQDVLSERGEITIKYLLQSCTILPT